MEFLYAVFIDFALQWTLRLVFRVHIGAIFHILIIGGVSAFLRFIKKKKHTVPDDSSFPEVGEDEEDAHYELNDNE